MHKSSGRNTLCLASCARMEAALAVTRECIIDRSGAAKQPENPLAELCGSTGKGILLGAWGPLAHRLLPRRYFSIFSQ